jgi:hypothetical protein
VAAVVIALVLIPFAIPSATTQPPAASSPYAMVKGVGMNPTEPNVPPNIVMPPLAISRPDRVK